MVQATVAGVPVTLENCRRAESPEPESGDLWLLCQTAEWQELPDCPAFLRMAYNRAQDAIVSVFLFPSEKYDAPWREEQRIQNLLVDADAAVEEGLRKEALARGALSETVADLKAKRETAAALRAKLMAFWRERHKECRETVNLKDEEA